MMANTDKKKQFNQWVIKKQYEYYIEEMGERLISIG